MYNRLDQVKEILIEEPRAVLSKEVKAMARLYTAMFVQMYIACQNAVVRDAPL
jgi:hypothetical protein